MATNNSVPTVLFRSTTANMGYSALVGALVIAGAAWRGLGHGARAPALSALVFCGFVLMLYVVIALPISAFAAWCAERVAGGAARYAQCFVVLGLLTVALFTFVASSLARSGPQWDTAMSYAVINSLLAWPTVHAMRAELALK